jgi:transcriptional regulator with XRE-family HTH domain
MDLGTELRTARERAGFSLPELAARTRIPLKSLRALEENDFEKVPPGVFIRSFIRTYAREVGVDPATAITEYRAMAEPIDDASLAPLDDQTVDELQSDVPPDVTESRPGWGYALIAAALVIALLSINRHAANNSAAAVATRTVARPAVSAEPVSAEPISAEPPQPVATAGTGIGIEMRAQGLCWIRAVVDGQFAFARLLQPGESETLTGLQDITLRIGDPAALSFSINGRPGEALGPARIPVTVRFGSDGKPQRVS